MDPSLARERIRKMKDIIFDEAQDKVKKIKADAENQANIEKNKLINLHADKIDQEFKDKVEKHKLKLRIERSTMINKARISTMEERQKVMIKVKEDSKEALKAKLADKNIYKPLLKKMVIQGLIKLMERDVQVRCREEDVALVESIIEEASKEFTQLILQITGVNFPAQVTVDTNNNLRHSDCVLGGVVLAAQKGSIICNNTLDARLELCYQDSIPDARRLLFPELSR